MLLDVFGRYGIKIIPFILLDEIERKTKFVILIQKYCRCFFFYDILHVFINISLLPRGGGLFPREKKRFVNVVIKLIV